LLELRNIAPNAQILLTRGASGMTLFNGETVIEQASFKVAVRDTVGCGDASMGGWMASLLQQPTAPPQRHLQVSAATAALAATHAGPTAPSAAEVEALLLKNGFDSWLT
jgi:fructokinase